MPSQRREVDFRGSSRQATGAVKKTAVCFTQTMSLPMPSSTEAKDDATDRMGGDRKTVLQRWPTTPTSLRMSDADLLRIEMETLWGKDAYGRFKQQPHIVLLAQPSQERIKR
jgi:hypothetical protein